MYNLVDLQYISSVDIYILTCTLAHISSKYTIYDIDIYIRGSSGAPLAVARRYSRMYEARKKIYYIYIILRYISGYGRLTVWFVVSGLSHLLNGSSESFPSRGARALLWCRDGLAIFIYIYRVRVKG